MGARFGGCGNQLQGRAGFVVDGGRWGEELFLWSASKQMHGSMMINFSFANQRAGNAGLGKLGPPCLMSAVRAGALALDDGPWHCGLGVAKVQSKQASCADYYSRSSGSTRPPH